MAKVITMNGVSRAESEPIQMKIERPIGDVTIEQQKEDYVIAGKEVSLLRISVFYLLFNLERLFLQGWVKF